MAILVGFKSKYATQIAEGNLDVDENKDTTPLPLIRGLSKVSLAERQKYHFNRSLSSDSRCDEGARFYNDALFLFDSAIRSFNSEKAKLKLHTFNEKDEMYLKQLKYLEDARDKKISQALFVLGKALHCFQDYFAHGNITAGSINGVFDAKIQGHAFYPLDEKVDNPYFEWKSGSNKQRVYNFGELSNRYYDTQDTTLRVLLTFLNEIGTFRVLVKG